MAMPPTVPVPSGCSAASRTCLKAGQQACQARSHADMGWLSSSDRVARQRSLKGTGGFGDRQAEPDGGVTKGHDCGNDAHDPHPAAKIIAIFPAMPEAAVSNLMYTVTSFDRSVPDSCTQHSEIPIP